MIEWKANQLVSHEKFHPKPAEGLDGKCFFG
jgi:hypothetical protein